MAKEYRPRADDLGAGGDGHGTIVAHFDCVVARPVQTASGYCVVLHKGVGTEVYRRCVAKAYRFGLRSGC